MPLVTAYGHMQNVNVEVVCVEKCNQRYIDFIILQRGKTAYTRISSATADEKFPNKVLENLTRPNTTHTFRVRCASSRLRQ